MARFKVYNASAGAGKTYSLVYNFLKICLADTNPRRFMSILAITFTNKAANEMKDRIVKALRELHDFQKSGAVPSMMDSLCNDLKISREKLSYRAGSALKTILHQYSAFSVSTIDKFTNRLIRSFARDLQLNTNYEVELDNDGMLREAIDQMMAELEEDSITTSFLLRFVNENLEEGKSPRPEQRLLDMGQNLFREEAFTHIRQLREIPPQRLLEIIDEMNADRARIEKHIQKKGEELLTFVHECGLDKDCFSRGTVYNYISYVAEGQSDKWVPGVMVTEALSGEKPFYAKKDARELAPLFEPVEEELRARLRDLVDSIDKISPQHHLLSKVLSNIYTLAVLSEMDHQLQIVKENSNRLPIGEFNKLISEKLEQEPADYLFEKLGERYRHFFIDEFQDTSVLQWKNLLPLVNNAMAAGGTAMVVGDGKQSIYRWRGGDVNQFIGLSRDEDTSNKVLAAGKQVELYERETLQLPVNYRSRRNIVEFNNRFFAEAAEKIEGEAYRELYRQSAQEVHRGEGGYVELQLIEHDATEKERYAEEQCQRCLHIIRDAQARHYPLSDMAILVRNNKEGSLLAEFLLEQGIAVISPDSLNVSGSPEVRAIISFLGLLSRPDDLPLRYDFLHYLSALPVVKEHYEEQHTFMAEMIELPSGDLHQKLTALIPGYDLAKIQLLSLSEKVYFLVQALGLHIQQNPFLHAFMDQLHTFHEREGEDLAGFMRWWEEKGHKENIALPETANAVRIMTIHKSKGLQFGICILAFADWLATREIGVTRVWLNLSGEDTTALPSALVGLSDPGRREVIDPYQEAYERNKELVYFDNLNLMYVAFTRAVEELYVLGGEGLHQQNTRVHRYLKTFMEQEGQEDQLVWGEKSKLPAQETAPAERGLRVYSNTTWQHKLKVAATAPLYWQSGELSDEIARGKKLHGLLSEIKTAEDIEPTLKHHVDEGKLGAEEAEELHKLLSDILNHQELKRFFDNTNEVLNEMEILAPGKGSYRPDRVVIEGNQAHIIDYKTGRESDRHFKQLSEYRHLLSEMGYPNGENLLVYIGDKIELRHWNGQQKIF